LSAQIVSAQPQLKFATGFTPPPGQALIGIGLVEQGKILAQIKDGPQGAAPISVADHLAIFNEFLGFWDVDSSEPASNLRCLRVLRAELIANQLGYVGKKAEEVTALQQTGLPAGQVVVYID